MDEIWHRLVQDRGFLTLPLGLVLASLVTLHVLLRKREIATSVGWIGLAWFAPFTGGVAYFVFGVNRVRRRARRLRPGGSDASGVPDDAELPTLHARLEGLVAGIRAISGRALVGGNAVHMLQDGDLAYPAMLDAIAGATRSVGLSSYIFRADAWGTRFIDALAAARGRGVAVRVLIDGVGGGWLRAPACRALRRRGIPATLFLHSPLPWRMPFLNLRSHRKLLLVDGRVGFTGGLNIGDENVLAGRPAHPVSDTHFRVEGPVICQLSEAFAQDWAFAANEMLDGDAWLPPADGWSGEVACRVVASGPDEDIEKIEFAVLQAVACAQESVAVMTPYFLPDDRLVAALSLAAMRGVGVDVIVPQRGNHPMVDWATRANVGPLLENGVRIWLCPPPFRHSKLMVVDGAWSLVGSCNWDIRSFRLNFELCVENYDTALAAELSAFMRGCRGAPLLERDLRARSVAGRLRDSAARLLMPYL